MKMKDPPYDEKNMVDLMRNYRKIIVWGIMLAGFLAGILFVNLSGDTYLEKNSFWLRRLSGNYTEKRMENESLSVFSDKKKRHVVHSIGSSWSGTGRTGMAGDLWGMVLFCRRNISYFPHIYSIVLPESGQLFLRKCHICCVMA